MASLFKHIIKLDHTISTNTYALELLKSQDIKEGTVICANFQSKGQGERGFSWESEYGKNLLMSIVSFLCYLLIFIEILSFIQSFNIS